MVFAKALLIAACLAVAKATPLRTRDDLSFDYNSDKVRGVNLGGWFVLEPWIRTSLFENANGAIDEWTFCENLGPIEALNRLEDHWASWITEDDFAEMASYGLNHVRLGVGYWSFTPRDGEPYVQGNVLTHIDNAITWAGNHGLKVIIDLHGVQGSQNAFDNSGRNGSINWQQGTNVQDTLDTIKTIATRYVSNTETVTAIQLVNEPANCGLDMELVKDYYDKGYSEVRDSNQYTAVVIHDAFEDIDSYWNGFMSQGSAFTDVILDTHLYQVFTQPQIALKPCDHIQAACGAKTSLSGTDKWTIVGEWTGAQTDCAKWLNGYGRGARYDNTLDGWTGGYYGDCQKKSEGTVEDMLEVDKTNLQYYVEAQLDVYEAHSGWVFWTWKTESAPEWHYQNLTRAGLIPNPVTSRKFAGQCGSTACLIPGS